MFRNPLVCSNSPDTRGWGNKTEMSEGCITGSDCLNTLPLREGGGHNGIAFQTTDSYSVYSMRRLAKWSIGIGSFIGGLIALLALLLCTGVIRVYGLTTGYNQLPKGLQARVVFSQGSLTDLDKALAQVQQQRSVLLVNGHELREAIARKGGKWLVYIYQEGCSSPSCPTLSSVTHYAEQLGARPLFVAVDLRSELFLHPEPILSIDFR